MSYREPHDFPSERGVPGDWWDNDISEPEFLRRIIPPSNWDDRALAHIDAHIAAESSASLAYEALAELGYPAIKYLAVLIAADERRHHQLLSDIASALRAQVNDGPAESVPIADESIAPEREALLIAEIQRLRAVEEKDADELKTLGQELTAAPEESIWPLLIEFMELDTAKHIRILKSIELHVTHHRPRC